MERHHTTKKVAFRDELGPRPWSMVTIRHVFWGLRGLSENFFFSFSRPSIATDWAKTCPMVVQPVVDDDFSLPAAKSTQICALTSMGPKCQRHWRSFFLGRAPVWASPVEPFMILDHGSQTSASQNEKTLNSWILFHPWFLATRL